VGISFSDNSDNEDRFTVEVQYRKRNGRYSAWIPTGTIDAVTGKGTRRLEDLFFSRQKVYNVRVVAANASGSTTSGVTRIRIR
jgi:protein involved in temperature-dependent protein secretion